MPAASYDIYVEQGATYYKRLIWRDASGTPIDVTGYTARMQFRKTIASEVELLATTENGYITVGTTDGEIVIEIPADITAGLSFRSGVYDLEIINGQGFVTRLIEGGVDLSREVTRT